MTPLSGQTEIDFVFQLGPDEAVVYVGITPPLGDYFSFWMYWPDKAALKGRWLPAPIEPLQAP